MKLVCLIGRRFGRLIVLERVENDKYKNRRWLCRCDCGKDKVIHGGSLSASRTLSCGCLQKEIVRKLFTKHGHKKDKYKIYSIWQAMKQRCSNFNNREYHNYGGRGIKVCRRWQKSFDNFLEDMGEVPEGHQIDRIDNNGNYCKSNCRWATRQQQQRNRRNNHLITYGDKIQTLVEWSEETGIREQTISARLRRGWSIKNSLTTSVRKCKNI